jgi:uncharacterized protein
MKKLLAAAVLAFAASTGHAQQAAAPAPVEATAPLPDANPAMWVVRDDDTTIYLFGTFHMLDARPWFNDEVKTAFDAADELVLEARLPEDLTSLQPLVLRYAIDQQGHRLSDQLSAEQYATLDSIVTGAGAPAGAFNLFEPWFVSISLPAMVGQQRLGLRAEHGPEMVLSAAARERGIEIGELEGIEWQFQLFDGLPADQQLTMLRNSLSAVEQMDEMMAPMLAAWSSGDVSGLVQLQERSSEQDPAMHELLFTHRNRRWAEWIDQRLDRPGTIFIAVGAGHLAGAESVQAVLAERGISAERVAGAGSPQPGS